MRGGLGEGKGQVLHQRVVHMEQLSRALGHCSQQQGWVSVGALWAGRQGLSSACVSSNSGYSVIP